MNFDPATVPIELKDQPTFLNGHGGPGCRIDRARISLYPDLCEISARAPMPWQHEGGSGASLSVGWKDGEWEVFGGLNSLPEERALWLPALRALVERILSETDEGRALAACSGRRKEGAPCFVRFGKLPAAGRSYNHRDGFYEQGVSVYAARRTAAGYWLNLRGTDAVSALFVSAAGSLYEVTGEEAGTGSDGEPLLLNCKARRVRQPVLGIC